MRYRNLNNTSSSIKLMYGYAVTRYERQDSGGAANTIYNIARQLIPHKEDGSSAVNFYKLQPIKGTIEDAIDAYNNGKIMLALRLLKHLQLEFHYNKLPGMGK